MEEIKISIIVPVYNSEEYISETIYSVAQQTFKQFEVVLVDDGSTDHSISIAEDILINSKINYQIIRQKNSGLSAARNTGIRNAKGEYICFLDSDDIIVDNHLENLYLFAQEKELEGVFCNFEYTQKDNRYGSKENKGEKKILLQDKIFRMAILRKPPIFVCGFLLKKDFIQLNNLYFNEKLRFGEDSDYIYKVIFSLSSLGYIEERTYKYLSRDNSIMKSITKKQAEIFVEEFEKTHIYMKLKTKNLKLVNVIYNRELLGFLHAYATNSKKTDFINIKKKINCKNIMKYSVGFGDFRLFILSFCLYITPGLFYNFFAGER